MERQPNISLPYKLYRKGGHEIVRYDGSESSYKTNMAQIESAREHGLIDEQDAQMYARQLFVAHTQFNPKAEKMDLPPRPNTQTRLEVQLVK